MRARLCAAILVLEAIVLGLTTPVLISVTGVSRGTGLGVGLGLAGVAVLLAGLSRRPGVPLAGFALQVAATALGVLVAVMWFLGLVFLALYATAYVLGGRIDADRARWAAEGRDPVEG